MTLAMPDSIRVNDLPPGYPAYLGYADGQWPTAQALREKFPSARLVILTVTGTHLEADGIDCEPGNVDAAGARNWVLRKLAENPDSWPVIYASVTGQPGYGMPDVLEALTVPGIRGGIARSSVRLLSAHYGAGQHVCGPDSCGESDIDMDGTQWTSKFQAIGTGAVIDMSALRDNFFTGSTGLNWTETIVRELPVVRPGDTGEQVRTVQGACNARHVACVIDGVFGPQTHAAVRTVQSASRIVVDGVVGPQTWPVLLGIA